MVPAHKNVALPNELHNRLSQFACEQEAKQEYRRCTVKSLVIRFVEDGLKKSHE
jgi:hypothetical protein